MTKRGILIKKFGNPLFLIVGFAAAVMFYMIFHALGDSGDNWDADIFLAHDKGNIPSFQFYFEQQGQKARQDTGFGFTPVSSQTTDLYINRMKASLPTENAPGLFTWWSTRRVEELVERGLVSDLTHLWEKHDSHYPREVRDAYTIDGKVYGFPYSIEYWPIWYNKKIFDRLGIREPETWDDFIEICDVLKTASIDPILTSLQYDWYALMWFAQLIIGEDPDFYRRLCSGEASHADPVVEEALRVYADMIRQGYFSSPSANMFTNAGYLWNNERFGMVLAGSWYYSTVLVDQNVDEETIGVFILPARNPSGGKHIMMESGPIFTAKHSRNREQAEIVADWWMGPEGNSHFSQLFGSFSANKSVDSSYLAPERQKLLSLIKKENCGIVNRYWEAAPIPVVNAAMEALSHFMVNPDTMENVITALVDAEEAQDMAVQ